MMATEVETVEAPVRSLASIGYGEDSWGGGVFGVVENPSPFPRINGLRNRFQDDRPLTIDSERAAPATEACRKHEGKPQQIKVAAVLGHILKNVSLQIAEGQLLAGDSAAPPKSCPIHPEFSYGWIVNELLGIADYWQGRTLSDGIAPVRNEPGPHDHKGVTAIINSAARLDQRLLTNGALLNIRIVPSSLEGPRADDNLASPLIRACFRRGGSHLQIYVESREVLIDADAHPDKYPGLLVYVNGYSTLWDELGETLKREIIARSDPSIDENTGLTPPGQGF